MVSQSRRSQIGTFGGNGCSAVGIHVPIAFNFVTNGKPTHMIAATLTNVSWNEGSNRSLGRHASNARVHAPSAFRRLDDRYSAYPIIRIVNITHARRIGGSPPTAIPYSHRMEMA